MKISHAKLVFGLFLFLCLAASLPASEPGNMANVSESNTTAQILRQTIGRAPSTEPMLDRAKGYLLASRAKSAITNYGNVIDWHYHPAGLWDDYTYLPSLSFLAGVPGQVYSSNFEWNLIETIEEDGVVLRQIWESADAYNAWFEDGDTSFVGVVFDVENDRGIWLPDSVSKKPDIESITDFHQWGQDHTNQTIFISVEGELNPNSSSARVGLIRPWALRPKFLERIDLEEYDVYDYGADGQAWNADDDYAYYGANTVQSWFTRYNPSTNTDWNASSGALGNTHGTEMTAGDIFGDTPFSDPGDSYPLLAHSSYPETWPKDENEDPFWPGWWKDSYNPDLQGCSGYYLDPDCWEEVPGEFVSDMDVYMEFDDRWAHRGNQVLEDSANSHYEATGYPMGLKVMAQGHSFDYYLFEDFLYVKLKVRNESGDWCAFERDQYGNEIPVTDENGVQICGEAMIMPDGTKLNQGRGFDYKETFLGFYMDADVLIGDINGYNSALHTNADDFMQYHWEPIFGAENVSMAEIFDYDGVSGPATELGIVATQLLATPLASDEVDLDMDGFTDIFPGEPLKMTDWHWFDWYNRPGVVNRESNNNCCAGDLGRHQALNKEEIMYKLMAGDTTNLSPDEAEWFFHSADPDLDHDHPGFNPHFDSIEGIYETEIFQQGEEGLDCVFIMSSGPFDLKVGEEVPFSFAVIFGNNQEDLIQNARHMLGFSIYHFTNNEVSITSPVSGEYYDDEVEISWEFNSITEMEPQTTTISYLPFDTSEWVNVAELVGNPGEYPIGVAELGDNPWAKIRVIVDDGVLEAFDESDYFIVDAPGNSAPVGWVYGPEEDEVVSDSVYLSWDIGDAEQNDISIGIFLTNENGDFEEVVVENLVNTEEYLWNTTVLPNQTNVMLRFDFSDQEFTTTYFSPEFVIINTHEQLPDTLLQHISGISTAIVIVEIFDESLVTGHNYTLTFELEETYELTYTVEDVTTETVLIAGVEVTPESFYTSPFDGLQIYVEHQYTDFDTAEWSIGDANYSVSMDPYSGNPLNRVSADYSIEFFEMGIDTVYWFNTTAFEMVVPFKVYNLSRDPDNPINLCHNNLPPVPEEWEPGYSIQFLENEVPGYDPEQEWITWTVTLSENADSNPWEYGDEVVLHTHKGLTYDDAYFFSTATFGVDLEGQIPTSFELKPLYPNPFNFSITIPFSVSRSEKVEIVVNNILGQRVRTLLNEERMPGRHTLQWNGKSDLGTDVSSGIYFVYATAGKVRFVQKIALVR